MLVLTAFTLTFSACGGDDIDESNPFNNSWVFHNTDKDSKGTHTFTFSNGSVTYTEKWVDENNYVDIETYNGTYSVDGDIITMKVKRDEFNYWKTWVFKWSLSGKTLTLIPNNEDTKDDWALTQIVLTKQ